MFDVTQAYDGEEGLYIAEQNIHDVIVLDIMLPQLNGYELLRQLRHNNITTPVLILTAKDSIDNKIRGFHEGADDYLVKPFHREELLLRLEAIIRRTVGNFQENVLKFIDLELNLKNSTISLDEEIIKLNGKQFEMLEYLIHNKNMIVTKDQIFDRIWGYESETSTSVVEVYASNLRKSLKKFNYDGYIKSFRGLGYMISENG